jgi:FkbM family methyltransferase
MPIIKQLIPVGLKQQGKYFLYDLLKIPYTRSGIPLEIAKWLPADKEISFIDIGASVGDFSDHLCQHYKISKGILIEPLTKWIPLLEEKFPDKDIFKVINCVVSETNGSIDFYISEEFDSISSIFEIKSNIAELASINIQKPVSTKMDSKTLDAITAGQKLNKIDLIKIDVQGAEHEVLNGGKNTLLRTRLVYTEFSFKPLYEDSSTFFDLYKIFNENNFRMVSISKGYENANGELLQGDALFVNNAFPD